MTKPKVEFSGAVRARNVRETRCVALVKGTVVSPLFQPSAIRERANSFCQGNFITLAENACAACDALSVAKAKLVSFLIIPLAQYNREKERERERIN